MTVALYAGVPGSGKSTLALRHSGADVGATGAPLLVVDWQGVTTFDSLRRAPTLPDLLSLVYRDGCSARWTPGDPEEFDRLMRAHVAAGAGVHLLIDESRYCMSAQSCSRELSIALRTVRHHGGSIRLTTQSLRDFHTEALACVSDVFLFRLGAPRDLDRAAAEWGLDAAELGALPRFTFKAHHVGF